MFDMWRARPARRAANAALASFIRPRPDGSEIPGALWLQPHVLGFLATLVTLIAARKSGHLRNHALADVQSRVIDDLTGAGPDLIGEEICLLSSRQDQNFAAGCAGAGIFYAALQALPDNGLPSPDGDPERGQLAARRQLDELWQEHVSSRMIL